MNLLCRIFNHFIGDIDWETYTTYCRLCRRKLWIEYDCNDKLCVSEEEHREPHEEHAGTDDDPRININIEQK